MRFLARFALTMLATWIVSSCAATGGEPSTSVAPANPGQAAGMTPTPAAPTTAAPSAEPTAIGTVTLTADACSVIATAEATAGRGFSISVVNGSSDPAGFDLWLLHDATTYEAWVELAEQAQANFDAGGPPGSDADIRPFADPIDVQEAVDPGQTGTLVAREGDAGTYAMQCWRFPATGPIRLQAAGPVAVSP